MSTEMRRKDREVKSAKELLEIINICKVCRIAVEDEEGIYIIPLNFGYEYNNGKLVLYFHSAKDGRKIRAIRNNNKIAFEMDCSHRLIESEKVCGYSYSYKSITGNGKAFIIEDTEEKKHALELLMKHQTGKKFGFTDRMTENVCIFRIEAEEFKGKCHEL